MSWLKVNHRFKLIRLFLSSFHNVRSLAANSIEGMGDSFAVSGGKWILFGAESFIFQSAIQKVKDQDI